jgi:hypothetical protein
MVAPIEQIETVIAMYREAAEANQKTPTRRGNVVWLSPDAAADVMMTGDLHGHRGNFDAIVSVADLETHPRRHLILQEVCHGGPSYPSTGGCMSHLLLDEVARLKVRYPDRVHFILGNHELAELTDYPIQKNRQMLNLLFRLGMQHVYGPATDKVREAMLAFLGSCPLAVRLSGGVFVTHSLPEVTDRRPFDVSIFSRPITAADLGERGAVFALVWGRDYRRENAEAFARLVEAEVLVTGHEPCPEGSAAPNDRQIILDCCGDRAAYAILPADRDLTHAEIVARIERLP